MHFTAAISTADQNSGSCIVSTSTGVHPRVGDAGGG